MECLVILLEWMGWNVWGSTGPAEQDTYTALFTGFRVSMAKRNALVSTGPGIDGLVVQLECRPVTTPGQTKATPLRRFSHPDPVSYLSLTGESAMPYWATSLLI